jgi:hypothetical protein
MGTNTKRISSVRTWENLHNHQTRDTNSGKFIAKIGAATQRCKVTNNGVTTNTRYWLHCPHTPHFITARVAVILAHDNYYDCTHNYDNGNPLLFPRFLFIPQHPTFLIYTKTSKSSYRISSYPITFLRTPLRNERRIEHRSPKERNYLDVLATSQLEVLTLNAGEKTQTSRDSIQPTDQSSGAHEFYCAFKFPDEIPLETENSRVWDETNNTLIYCLEYKLHWITLTEKNNLLLLFNLIL